jgi:hypothetical protein
LTLVWDVHGEQVHQQFIQTAAGFSSYEHQPE